MGVVSVVRAANYEECASSVRRAIDLIGGPEHFASRGEPVLVKPNMLSPSKVSKAVTTHPLILEAVLDILLELGAKPVVGDSPGIGSAGLVGRVSGLAKVCEKRGVPLIELGQGGVRTIKGETFQSLELAAEALDAGTIWNLPKWKTHSMMVMTLGVKNLYGCVPGARKVAGHLRAGRNHDGFALMLLDIWSILQPRLTLLDGIVAMEGAGPGSGTPIERGLILASDHAPSLDYVAVNLSGFTPEQIHTVRLSIKSGILDPSTVAVVGEEAKSTRFAPPPGSPADFSFVPGFVKGLFGRFFSPTPEFDPISCVDCGICVGACPAHVLDRGKPPVFELGGCIRCYCCQELCPEGAVSVPRPLSFLRRRHK